MEVPPGVLETFGQRLRRLRLQRGLSQRALAERAQLSRHVITRLEAERFSPTLEVCHALARALGVEVTRLITPTERAGLLDLLDQVEDYCSPPGRRLMAQMFLLLYERFKGFDL
jgi:putative transcriptional regulator